MPCRIVAAAACRALITFDITMSSRSEGRYLTDIYFVNIQQDVTCCMIDVFKHILQLPVPSKQTDGISVLGKNSQI